MWPVTRDSIVHLDLKPENLVVDASKKTIYLIDFGAAQEIQSGKQHISSSSYMKHYVCPASQQLYLMRAYQ